MKALAFLVLALVGFCLAAPASVPDANTASTIPRHSFQLYQEEFCFGENLQARFEYQTWGYYNKWTATRGWANRFNIDGGDEDSLSVYHDYVTSQIHFEYIHKETCAWRNNFVDDGIHCGWCDLGDDMSWGWRNSGSPGPLDCTGDAGQRRWRTLKCTFLRTTKAAASVATVDDVPDSALDTPVESTLAARDEPSDPAPTTTITVSSTLDVPIAASYNVTDPFHDFRISWSEYCIDGALAARGWWADSQPGGEIPLNDHQQVTLNLHPPKPAELYPLVIGPYDFVKHKFNIRYGNCRWSSRSGHWCGFCQPAPWTAGELNCVTGAPSAQRLTYVTCSFFDKNINGQITDGNDQPRDSVPEDVNTLTARDLAIDETAEADVPKNLFRFYLTYSEYCEHGELKAKGWIGNGQYRTEIWLNTTHRTRVNLHPEHQLFLGPYNFDAHAFELKYDGCNWTTEGGYPCGWCELQQWSLGPLYCQTGKPSTQRLTFRVCYMIDNHMGGQAASRDTESPPSVSVEPAEADNRPVVARDVVTVVPHRDVATPTADIANAVAASTVVLQPAIIETTPPTHEEHQIILPFHFVVWEYCIFGMRLARGKYTNGGIAQEIDLKPGLGNSLVHFVPGYPNLEIGPFQYGTSTVRFSYNGCEFFDYETWKSCGECRAGLWSAGPLDCKDPRALRIKEMDCSVLLGTKIPNKE